MKIGFGSYALRWAVGTPDWQPSRPLDARALVDRAAALGAEVLQILENVPLDGLSRAELASLARRAAGAGIALEVGFRGCRAERVRRHLPVAEALDARLLRVVLEDGPWAPAVGEAVAILRDLLPDLRAAGVTLAIENHSSLRPAEIARIIATVGDPAVAACLDVLNSVERLVGPLETTAALAPYTVSAHFKDVRVVRHGAAFRLAGCPLGEGEVDCPAILAAVRDNGRSPALLVESWMDRLGDEAATLAEEERWVRHGMAYLRQLAAMPGQGGDHA